MKTSPFEYVKSVSQKTEYMMRDDFDEKCYAPWLTNDSFSKHMDSVLFANMMNIYYGLDNKLQYDFYWYGLPKSKRFAKEPKEELDEDVVNVMQYYQLNRVRAVEYVALMTKEALIEIKDRLNPGGSKKNK